VPNTTGEEEVPKCSIPKKWTNHHSSSHHGLAMLPAMGRGGCYGPSPDLLVFCTQLFGSYAISPVLSFKFVHKRFCIWLQKGIDSTTYHPHILSQTPLETTIREIGRRSKEKQGLEDESRDG